MQINIKSKIVFLFCLFLSFSAQAQISYQKSFSVYGSPKYADNFRCFDYVNPQAPKGGVLKLPAYGSFDSFNPFIFKGIAFTDGVDLSLESLGFVSVDDKKSVYPLLAKEFELPADKTFIGFILNPEAEFSDGTPVLADDVIFSFNSLIQKGSPIYKVYYGDVESVKKINDYHVRFYFKKGVQNRELPLILSQFKVFSAKQFKDKDFATPDLIPLIGSGPYIITNFEVNKFVELERNRKYWGKNLSVTCGFFNFDKIRYDFYQDTTVTLQSLFAGAIDAREEYIAKIWMSGYDNKLVNDGKIIKENMSHNNPAVLQFFGFNTRLSKFSDRRVREAIGLAFNFDWANRNLFYNQYKRIYSLFSNTDLAAEGLPEGKEKQILLKYKNKIPSQIFEKPYTLPDNSTAEKQRQNLKKAVTLLNETAFNKAES